MSQFDEMFADGAEALILIHGGPVTYTPRGQAPQDIQAILANRDDQIFDSLDGQGIERQNELQFFLTDIPSPDRGDVVLIGGKDWSVASVLSTQFGIGRVVIVRFESIDKASQNRYTRKG